jgi:tetratricopeptide (TPR) repeat protein
MKRSAKDSATFRPNSIFSSPLADFSTALLLAVLTFLVYWPSLSSGFVYDSHFEILQEGFITSIANLPDVLSLKVLGMNLMLGPRPGSLLYLMLLAAVCGRDPFGYHLCSNLLHAANAALLFGLLLRLISGNAPPQGHPLKLRLAALAVTLVFALHPLAAETVAAVNYCSDLLVTFFTLLALHAATAFRPDKTRAAFVVGGAGTLCAFAAVTAKESGLTASLLLVVYWFLFRRGEAIRPWLLFLGAALAVTVLFLAARFYFAPPGQAHLKYLGGSFFQVFRIQPRLWAFMIGQFFWPAHLSADYTLENAAAFGTPLALAILTAVLLLQGWLSAKSRLGALGVAIYWLGLVTVSNFTPLYRILGDRFYYLPLAGVALQLLAVLLMLLPGRFGFWIALAPLLVSLLPLGLLTLAREKVFTNQFTLWTDTARVSPFSVVAQYNLGNEFLARGRMDEAIACYQRALQIDPGYSQPHNNLANALYKKGRIQEAITQFRIAVRINPGNVEALTDLGYVLSQNGQIDEGLADCEKAVQLSPRIAEVYNNLGLALFQKGRVDDAITEYQKCIAMKSDDADAHKNLGNALLQKGKATEAVAELRQAAALEPTDPKIQSDLAKALFMAGQTPGPR